MSRSPRAREDRGGDQRRVLLIKILGRTFLSKFNRSSRAVRNGVRAFCLRSSSLGLLEEGREQGYFDEGALFSFSGMDAHLLEPGDCVLALALEDVPSVHGLVVVDEDGVSGLHLEVLDVLLGDGLHFVQLGVGDRVVIAEIHVRLVDLGGAALEPFRAVD